MKKVLLTSAVALAAFGAVQAVSADTNNGQTVSGRVNPATGKIDQANYTGNTVVSAHTGVVPADQQYKPATPVKSPYDFTVDKDGNVVRPVPFENGTHVRFHVRDIQERPVAGVKVEILVYEAKVKEGKVEYVVKNPTKPISAVSNEAGDVELAADAGDLLRYRVAYVPKGYVVRQAKLVTVDGKANSHYTLTGYRGEHENLANGETHEDAGATTEGTFVVSGSAYLNHTVNGDPAKPDMFTNASVDLVLEKTDSYNVVKEQWIKEEDGWKYYSGNQAVTGWKQLDGNWYYLNEQGVMQTGWKQVNGTWYYLNASGAMVTGWLKDGNTWYFLEASGAMKASQWFQVKDKWYYVNASGALAVNTTVGGYTVNGNGEWVN